jgi:hypothetical protein
MLEALVVSSSHVSNRPAIESSGRVRLILDASYQIRDSDNKWQKSKFDQLLQTNQIRRLQMVLTSFCSMPSYKLHRVLLKDYNHGHVVLRHQIIIKIMYIDCDIGAKS